MLSVTLSQGKLASSWNTTPMPSGTSPAIGLPSSVAVPSVGRVQPGDDLEQRRLAAARRADHHEELAAHQVEIDRPERLDFGLRRGRRKDARDAAQRDVSLGHGYCVFRLRSSGRKLSSMILLQSGSFLSAPTSFCARIISFIALRLTSPAPQ